uniref:Xylulose kinase n=1 Tax=Trichuris muris TaxID=70415 RepID=A0A5S6QSK8_TRIMR
MEKTDCYYLGFDLGTQQLKGILTDDKLTVQHVVAVNYDAALPSYRTSGGVHHNGAQVTAPVLMWIKALELALDDLRRSNFDLSKVAAVSGAAQQHGSVYWKSGAEEILANLSSSYSLSDQLENCFATYDSPVWMDHSTQEECNELEAAVGGPLSLAELTGSAAHLRFTGPQILKKCRKEKSVYDEAERISLVSSFLCSLFLGRFAPIDFSDGSGMNLLDLKKHVWAVECLKIFPADLCEKLGCCVPSTVCLDCISPYFVNRYGFSSTCRVVVFTGDNPSSLAGLNQRPTDLSISLGTSDTVFVWMSSAVPIRNGHIFCNPIDPAVYMGMICFRNGDCTRKQARYRLCGGNATWSQFERLVDDSPPGNYGCMGFFHEYEEIGSKVAPEYILLDADGCRVAFFEKQIEARAVVEHQCLAKRLYFYKTGMRSKMKRILVTGGASNSEAVVQTLSDVFNLPVYRKDVPHSAALGGAVRAKHALTLLNDDLYPLQLESSPGKLVAEPRQSVVESSLTSSNRDRMQVYGIFLLLLLYCGGYVCFGESCRDGTEKVTEQIWYKCVNKTYKEVGCYFLDQKFLHYTVISDGSAEFFCNVTARGETFVSVAACLIGGFRLEIGHSRRKGNFYFTCARSKTAVYYRITSCAGDDERVVRFGSAFSTEHFLLQCMSEKDDVYLRVMACSIGGSVVHVGSEGNDGKYWYSCYREGNEIVKEAKSCYNQKVKYNLGERYFDNGVVHVCTLPNPSRWSRRDLHEKIISNQGYQLPAIIHKLEIDSEEKISKPVHSSNLPSNLAVSDRDFVVSNEKSFPPCDIPDKYKGYTSKAHDPFNNMRNPPARDNGYIPPGCKGNDGYIPPGYKDYNPTSNPHDPSYNKEYPSGKDNGYIRPESKDYNPAFNPLYPGCGNKYPSGKDNGYARPDSKDYNPTSNPHYPGYDQTYPPGGNVGYVRPDSKDYNPTLNPHEPGHNKRHTSGGDLGYIPPAYRNPDPNSDTHLAGCGSNPGGKNCYPYEHDPLKTNGNNKNVPGYEPNANSQNGMPGVRNPNQHHDLGTLGYYHIDTTPHLVRYIPEEPAGFDCERRCKDHCRPGVNPALTNASGSAKPGKRGSVPRPTRSYNLDELCSNLKENPFVSSQKQMHCPVTVYGKTYNFNPGYGMRFNGELFLCEVGSTGNAELFTYKTVDSDKVPKTDWNILRVIT